MSTELSQNLSDGVMTLLSEFVYLEQRRRCVEEELKELKQSIAKMQEILPEQFALNGVDQMRKDGMTVYMRHDMYVNKKGGVENGNKKK